VVPVEARSISKLYGGARVLDRVSVTFGSGLLTSLLGPSGSGKTTLLRIIGGFIAPDEGEIYFGDENVTSVPLWKRRIGMVFQSYALFPHMTIEQNVAFGVNRRGIRGEAARKETARALELVRLGGFEQRKPKELSGGQQQRWRSHAPSSPIRACCCSTSRCRPWIVACVRICRLNCDGSTERAG
jgi:spermidine/putrescine transport system ATP-binding protein